MLRSKDAIVIGPTPPGTGVMGPATPCASRESDVADQPRLAVRGGHAG